MRSRAVLPARKLWLDGRLGGDVEGAAEGVGYPGEHYPAWCLCSVFDGGDDGLSGACTFG